MLEKVGQRSFFVGTVTKIPAGRMGYQQHFRCQELLAANVSMTFVIEILYTVI